MNDTNNDVIGNLFGVVGYRNEKQIRSLIDNLELEQSIFFLNKSLEYAHAKGIFSMTETEVVSKSLSIINSILTKNEPTGEGTNNQ